VRYQLEDVVGKRTKAIERRLKDVQVLNNEGTLNILPELNNETIANDEDSFVLPAVVFQLSTIVSIPYAVDFHGSIIKCK